MKLHKYVIIRVVLAVVFVAGTFGVQPAKAETVDFGWVQGGGGTNLDYGTAIALDDGGNVYTTGFVTNGPGNQDGFLQKWDASGNPIWAKFVAGPGNDTDHDVALDGDGNVYVAGAYSNTVEFNPGNSDYDLTSEGLTDIFVIKYDGDGNFIWAKTIGGTSSDGGYGITTDASGNIYLTGIYVDTVDFDPGGGISTLTSAGAEDIFVLKLDSDGNFQWARSMGGPGSDYSFDVAVDISGNVFTTGYFSDTVDFDPGIGMSNLTSLGLGDLFISKLDSSGDFVWAQRMGGGSFDAGIEVAVDGWGNTYTVGYLGIAGAHDIFLRKLDGDGNLLWEHIIGAEAYDTGYGIALDGSGNVYYTGDFSGTVDFDPGAGTSNLTSAGDSDIFISKLDSDGNFVWAKNLGGTSADSGDGIVVQNDGSLYLIGTFSDTVDFNLGTGTSTLTSAGSLDVFIARLNLTPQIHYVQWNATGMNDGSSWTNAYIDLQSALAAASNGDEIWVAAGTYKPTLGTDRTISFVLKNGVAVYGGFAGTETAKTQRNYVTNVTVLNADIGVENDNSDNSYHVVVGSNTDNSAILDGFTVRGGNADHDSYLSEQSKGGGMYNETGSPTLSNMIFRDNFATSGGGIANRQSSPKLSNVTFTNNIAASLGGGMHNESSSSPVLTSVTLDGNSAPNGGGMHNLESTPKLTGVIFLNNGGTSYGAGGGMTNNHSAPILVSVTFSENSAGEGGGMYNYYGNPTLTNVTFSGNIADSGGGMRNELSNPILTNVTFSGNTVSSAGGGMYNSNNSNPILTDVMFSANVASSGSGMQNSHSNPVLTNVTFSGNIASSAGGGMYNFRSSPTLTNVTLNGNSAGVGGGGMLNDSSNPTLMNVTFTKNSATYYAGGMMSMSSRPTLINTLIANSVSGRDCDNTGIPLNLASSNNLIEDSACGLTDGVNGNIIGQDPNLGMLGNYGDFTQTISLQPGSLAINAGDDVNCPDTDQRGVTRPQGAHCDIGAFEYLPPLVVTKTADTNDGLCDADCSLREAIFKANPWDIINFDPSLAGATIPLTSPLLINFLKDVTIDGSGLSPQVVLSGQNTYRIMEVTMGAAVTISGVTFTGGNAAGGGAIYASGNSEVTLYNNIFHQNHADGDGGAISGTGSVFFTITGSMFSNNSAGGGGGAIAGDHITLIDSTLSGNSAGESGGAIYARSLEIRNTTLDQNQASEGGAIAFEGFRATVVNSTITHNEATESGGAIAMLAGIGSIDVFNSTFAGNRAPQGSEVDLKFGSSSLSLHNTILACEPGNTGCVYQGFSTDLNSVNSIIETGTLASFGLSDLADHGGTTQTMALLPGSSLSDAGDDTICADSPVNNLDQRGVTRPQGAHCDIGAFEAGPSLVVTTNADGGPGSLRQAVLDAEEGETITFDTYLAGQVIPFNSPLIIDKDLTIDGSALNPPLTLLGGPYTRIMEVKYPAKVTISGLVLTGGTATSGNGGAVYVESEFTAINSTFYNNKAINGGAIWGGRITLINSTLTQNIAAYDGGAVGGVILDIRNTTIQANEAYHDGGGIAIYGDGSAKVVNSTIFGNQAGNHGGGFFATGYTLLNIRNSTFAGNTAANGDEFMLGETRQVDFINTIFVCNAESSKCYVPAGNTISNTNSILGIGILQDYGLSEPADNGGLTHTMALFPGSPLIDAGDDTLCADSPVNNLDQRGVTRPQGAHCDIGAYEFEEKESLIHVAIGKADPVSYPAVPHESQQKSYPAVNDGPVRIAHTNNLPILAAERLIYKVNNIPVSFSEMMALPANQLDKVYWLPWYNNNGKDLDTQLRFGNVSESETATVSVFIGDDEMNGCTSIPAIAYPYELKPGESVRVSCTGVNAGPVRIESDINIVAAERLIYKVNNIAVSFSEMMALPANQLDNVYWLPWYNNVGLDTQLRIGNVNEVEQATVHLFIGDDEISTCTSMPPMDYPYELDPGQSVRVSCPNVNAGPLRIESDVNIVAAERLIFKAAGGVNTSFSEMMALPEIQLHDTYWLPWYNNVGLDTQLRIGNVSETELATVRLYVGNSEISSCTSMPPMTYPYELDPGESVRVSCANVNSGPLKIESDIPIVAAGRVIYKVQGVATSFSELLALPEDLLDATFWLPWYNNLNLDTQLRFGMP